MPTHRPLWVRAGITTAGVALSLAMIGGAVVAQSPAASPSTSAIPAASAAPVASTAPQLDVNTATQEEIAAAFTAAGIPNADRWAREVVEYRPYEADPTWTRLRGELGKYNIDPAVLEQILALLQV